MNAAPPFSLDLSQRAEPPFLDKTSLGELNAVNSCLKEVFDERAPGRARGAMHPERHPGGELEGTVPGAQRKAFSLSEHVSANNGK